MIDLCMIVYQGIIWDQRVQWHYEMDLLMYQDYRCCMCQVWLMHELCERMDMYD